MCLTHISTLVTPLSTWYVIICVYTTSLSVSPPYQLDMSLYSLFRLSTLVTSLSTWYVIICDYTTSLSVSPPYQLDMSPYSLFRLSNLVTSLSTWYGIICVYATSLPLSPLVTFLSTSSVIIILFVYPSIIVTFLIITWIYNHLLIGNSVLFNVAEKEI